jgi:hypothetical protein
VHIQQATFSAPAVSRPALSRPEINPNPADLVEIGNSERHQGPDPITPLFYAAGGLAGGAVVGGTTGAIWGAQSGALHGVLGGVGGVVVGGVVGLCVAKLAYEHRH